MSEAERKRRAEYKKRRKRWLIVQAVLLIVVAIGVLVCSVTYRRLDKTVYITYEETSSVDYKVKLKENEFYEEEYLPSGQAYVASLIDGVYADFSYGLRMDTKDVDYEYTYGVEAQLEIVDNRTDVAIFHPVYTLQEKKSGTQSSNEELAIVAPIAIDYGKYNDLANEFVKTYGLENTTSTLKVYMNISVTGSCKDFKEKSRNDYALALQIPLIDKTVEVEMTSTVPAGESKVLACDSDFNRSAFKTTIVVLSAFGGGLLIAFVAFVFLTRNEDINYVIKVQKLVSNYRSYVQKITNGFDTTGYQLLAVDSFNEMLAIRDTIQSPILMSENKDQTRTVFFIPTNTKILYTFEIRVENYDELYKNVENPDGAEVFKDENATAQSTTTEAVETVEVVDDVEAAETTDARETATELSVAEAALAEDEATEEVLEEALGAESKFAFGPKMDYSFEARLVLSAEEVKGYYKQVVDFVRAYGKVKVARSWKRERIYKGRKLFAALSFRANKLVITLAKDPTTANPKYHAKDVTGMKRYENTPMLMRITSSRKAKYSIELLSELFEAEGLVNENAQVKPTSVPKKSKTTLLKNNLIKIEQPRTQA